MPTCGACGASFSNEQDLGTHAAVHLPGAAKSAGGSHAGHAHESKFTCPGCGGAFATQAELKSHASSAHPMAAGRM